MSGGILCSGSIIYDTLVHPAEEAPWGTTTFVEKIEPHPGGNGLNTSLALAKTGSAVRLVGAVGDDDPGRYLLDVLCSAGVDAASVQTVPGPTAATIALVNSKGDRRFLHRMGVSAEVFATPIDFSPGLIQGMSHYHMASLFILPRLREHAPATLARARAAGLTTSLDTNWDPRGRWLSDLSPCLPYLDFVFVNEDEARMCTGHTGPREAAEVLIKAGAAAAVIKLGSRGCAVYTAGREILSPAFGVRVIDTTGAGDCFVGGFLSALRQGSSLQEAARFGNALGAMAVQVVGGAAGLENGLDVAGWMQGRE